jgi:arsenate reductase (glutaredoxin)
MTITIYGIRNCDTMKKARAWLDQHDVAYIFHDYRKDGVDGEQLQRWCDEVGWEKLLNRTGTTFRKLPDDEKTGLDSSRAIALMRSHPAMIKRPVLEAGARLIVGFQPQRYADLAG